MNLPINTFVFTAYLKLEGLEKLLKGGMAARRLRTDALETLINLLA